MAKSEKEIEIIIEGKEWEEALDKAFKKANKKAKIDGFRPGKAPKDVFIKHYGKESLYMDAADYAADIAYQKLLKDYALKNLNLLNIEVLSKKYIEKSISK